MQNDLITVLQLGAPFHPIVSFNSATDKLTALDFTAANSGLTPEVLRDTVRFTHYIHQQLKSAGARYGIGGYAEDRTIYIRSTVFDGTEPRRLHLGTDIWGAPHTAVMAPLDGIVHSFGFHPQLGNYGAVMILAHRLNNITFYTLYGHLSLASIKNVAAGDRIAGGDVIGGFGIPQENGWWPPHLHFQVIKSMDQWKGDYPGVCAFSEKKQWLDNCVDPDYILNLNRFV